MAVEKRSLRAELADERGGHQRDEEAVQYDREELTRSTEQCSVNTELISLHLIDYKKQYRIKR